MDIFQIGKNNYSIHSNEIAVKCSAVHSETESLTLQGAGDESCGFRQSTFLKTQFSVPNPAVFLLSKKLFLVYIFVHIDDKKPYKPFNQLDTSSRHTASSSPVNKEHFIFIFFLSIIFGEIQNRLFRLPTHFKINRTIIGTMIWWSVNPYYTLLPPHKKKKSQLPAICQFRLPCIFQFKVGSITKRLMVFKPLRCVTRQRKENTKTSFVLWLPVYLITVLIFSSLLLHLSLSLPISLTIWFRTNSHRVFIPLDRFLYCCRCTYCVASHSINPWINTTFPNKKHTHTKNESFVGT